jgi:hypothetical protein
VGVNALGADLDALTSPRDPPPTLPDKGGGKDCCFDHYCTRSTLPEAAERMMASVAATPSMAWSSGIG